jgi:hypothetical protein
MALTVNDLIPFVVVGASAVTALSTVAGIRLANQASERQLKLRLQHQDDKDQKEALRNRLEELYQLVDIWAGKFVIHHTTYRKVMHGELTYNQALDLAIDREQFDVARLFTLAELYFPESHKILEDIKNIRDELSRIQDEYKEQYRDIGPSSDGAKYSKVLTLRLMDFNKAIDSYKSSLANYARKV